jgi:hypothetical protein
MLFCFTNISAEIVLHILDYNVCTKHHILAQFCQCCYHKKHQKLSAQKLLCFSTKNVSEIDPSIGEKNLFKHDH